MSSQANQPLPEGYQLLEYRILKVLAHGGFSFVYLAHDEAQMPVAIKEYLPSTLALRGADGAVPVIPEEHMATFRFGMKCFFEEGRTLARLTHPNVVRVLNFFHENDTIYMVMRYERGRTLQEHIQALGSRPMSETWIRQFFASLLGGLREVHSNKLLHLDIKPGNIYTRNDGSPVLIDFGAARQTLTGEAAMLPPVYTPGFASPEHHSKREDLGPWSDIYSVGASMYACLSRTPPQPADQRREKDRLLPARRAWAGKYSNELLDIIDWCLRVDHMQRPQSVFALQKSLLGEREPDYHGEARILDHLKGAILKLARRGAGS